MFRNKILMILLVFYSFVFSQKKKIDTIYVIQEVIIHDTIYIEKSIDRQKIESAVLIKGDAGKKDYLQLIQNGKKLQIPIDSMKGITYTKKQSWTFGSKLHISMTKNSLSELVNTNLMYGGGIGFWVQKQLFGSRFSVNLGLDYLYFKSNNLIDSSTENQLTGYYFTSDRQPLLFQNFDLNHYQLQIPLRLNYSIKKLTCSAGIFGAFSQYKTTFITTSGTQPTTFEDVQTSKTNLYQIGFCVGLDYEIYKKISFGLHYFNSSSQNIFVNNPNYTLKIDNTFKENQLNMVIGYRF